MRIAGVPSDPPRGRGPAGSGRQRRDAGCTAKASGPGEQDDAGRGQRGAGRPQRADAERERRSSDPGQLGRPTPRRRRPTRSASASRSRPGSSARRHAPSGGVASPIADGERDEQRDRNAGRERGDGAGEPSSRHRGGEQHRRLPTPVDERAEQRAAEAERDRVRARHDAGHSERAGQVLGVDQEPDAEHRQRQPGDDRAREQAAGAGRGGDRVHGRRWYGSLVHAQGPLFRPWMRPVSR